MPSGFECEFRKKADFLAGEGFCGRKSNLHGEGAASQSYDWSVVACSSEFSKGDGGRCDPVLVVGHEIFTDDEAIRSDEILHGMRNAMRAQAGSNVGVEDLEVADDSAIPIRKQRESNLMLLGKALEGLPGIVTDRGEAETLPFDDRT